MDVVVAPREVRILLDADEDVEIAGRAAVESPLPLTRHAQPRAVVDAGGNLDGDVFRLAHAPGAVARLARLLDHFSRPAALRAGALHGEEAALREADLPPP